MSRLDRWREKQAHNRQQQMSLKEACKFVSINYGHTIDEVKDMPVREVEQLVKRFDRVPLLRPAPPRPPSGFIASQRLNKKQ